MKFSNRGRWKITSWILRASYIFTLITIFTICAKFYYDQKQLSKNSDQIKQLSMEFSKLDTEMRLLTEKAQRIGDETPKKISNPLLDVLMRGKSLKEKKEILANQPVDSDIIPYKQSLTFFQKRSKDKLEKVKRAWKVTDPKIKNQIVSLSRYMKGSNPFKGYDQLVNTANVDSSKSLADIHWAARELYAHYNNIVSVNNAHALKLLYAEETEIASRQSNLLEKFLLITLGALGVLAIFIFIPLDIFIQKVLDQLLEKTKFAEKETKRAELADRAKSEFLANMSHEIRTPMNGVMGMAELLMKTELDTKQKTFADIIVKSGSSLLTIINDILDFSKIDAGQMELDPAPFKISEAVEDVATLVSSKVVEKDLELAVRIAPELPEMYLGDIGRIRQIVTNLIGNAVKFTEQGHVFVDVNGTVDEGVANLIISIQDTGVGISANKCEHIFQKFSQVDESATRKHEGTGLGLAISSSLVHLMGGKISVESELGVGSTFSFEIALPVHGDEQTKKKVPVTISGSNILVVDDNEVNRTILLENLKAWNFQKHATASGIETLDYLENTHYDAELPDCIIIDYHMPEMNGGELTLKIRNQARYASIPIIMLTSVDRMEDGQNFSSLGIQGHLLKPARSSALFETIINVLQDANSQDNEIRSDVQKAMYIAKAGNNEDEEDQLQSAQKEAGMVGRSLEEISFIASNQEKQKQSTAANNNQNDVVPISQNIKMIPVNQKIDILIAEDNEVNQIVFRQILEETNYSFAIASNGVEALEMYVKFNPRVICMDVSMPVMNGHDATKEIRKYEEDKTMHTPIIAVTAHAIKGDMDDCIAAGMDDYLSKPISPNLFLEKVSMWLEQETKLYSVK